MTPQQTAAYINSAKTPADRQMRKAEVHGFMYGSGPKPFYELYTYQSKQPKPKEMK